MPSILVRLLFCTLSACLICGCEQEAPPATSLQQPPDSTAQKVLAWPLSAPVTSFDPVAMTNVSEAAVARQLFDTLVRLDQNLSLEPGIARKWEVDPTGRIYTFHLRVGITFHNGAPLTAQDVKHSLERLVRAGKDTFLFKHMKEIEGAEAFVQGQSEEIRGILAPNPLQIIIRLKKPHAPFLPALSIHQAGIVCVPDNSLQSEKSRRVVGSGPFVLESADDKSITMRPFKQYIDGIPQIDPLIFRFYAGSNIQAAIADFLAGELSAIPMVGPVEEVLRGRTGYRLVRRNTVGLFFYGFNVRKNAVLTTSMRKKIAQLIDKKEVTSSIHKDVRTPANTIIPLGLAGYRPSWNVPADNSGHDAQPVLPRSIRMLSAARNAAVKAEMAYFADRLSTLGCELQVEYILDWDEFYKRLAAGDCDMFRLAWYPDAPDLDEMFFPLFHSQGEYNHFGYTNPRVDELLEQARAMARLEDRILLYHQAEDILLTDLPAIPMWHEAMNRAVIPNIHGLDASPFGELYTSFASIRIE
ncbi:ABC transporter substrate-binding protein [Desulfocurvibacter africanus]|uniref:ABC transporter substrate-binding protein n=1 Tax=Desulfocurvibacter africanus TaxID=873 RepID=UPI0004858455|nr:ABC transporter substrate-binding protein [Desulfocurvibacter africanus]